MKRVRAFHVLVLLAAAAGGAGCSGAKGPGVLQGSAIAGFESQAAAVAKDPFAYMQRVRDHARAQRQYRLDFYRQERLGLVPTLRKMERIRASFRAEPFSVHFQWLDDDSEYVEAAFVRGRHENKVLLLPRIGLFGLPPAVARYNVQDAVTFQKARNPITDFGVARMMDRTLERIERAKGKAEIRYRGVERAGSRQQPAHRIELKFPRSDPYTNKRMDLYIDPRTDLPVGVYLWLPNGDLDAMYLYEAMDGDVRLADADFQIKTRPGKKPSATKTRTASAEPTQSSAPQ
ncbi:MAG: DUF1571 domain-containing protein [Phycisphaerae bacterium]|nr:DUF1571 domain-containing protein [Phycisphaerae bacterium]